MPKPPSPTQPPAPDQHELTDVPGATDPAIVLTTTGHVALGGAEVEAPGESAAERLERWLSTPLQEAWAAAHPDDPSATTTTNALGRGGLRTVRHLLTVGKWRLNEMPGIADGLIAHAESMLGNEFGIVWQTYPTVEEIRALCPTLADVTANVLGIDLEVTAAHSSVQQILDMTPKQRGKAISTRGGLEPRERHRRQRQLIHAAQRFERQFGFGTERSLGETALLADALGEFSRTAQGWLDSDITDAWDVAGVDDPRLTRVRNNLEREGVTKIVDLFMLGSDGVGGIRNIGYKTKTVDFIGDNLRNGYGITWEADPDAHTRRRLSGGNLSRVNALVLGELLTHKVRYTVEEVLATPAEERGRFLYGWPNDPGAIQPDHLRKLSKFNAALDVFMGQWTAAAED